jgi:hypothetical protein
MVIHMRFLAVLVLLLQLQPVIGSALCFHDTELSKPECAMPHDERPTADRTLTATGAEVPTGCASTVYCTRSTPAVLDFAQHLQIAALIQGAPVRIAPAMASDAALASPFHPPRV